MCGLTGFPDGPPMLLYGPYIDYVASSLGASAALAAVLSSRKSGKGAHLDLSQYESGLMFMAGALHDYFANGKLAERCGNADPDAVPHGAFRCRDGQWVTLSCWSDEDFAALARTMGKTSLVTEPRFATATARRANGKALEDIISAWTEKRSADEVAKALQANGVAAYPVVTIAGLFADPQLIARGQWRVRRHPEMGDQAYCFPPFDLEDMPGDIVAPAFCLGADNEFVFRDLVGLTETEFESYRKSGVFD
jgi:crotonobetainyl-CoA:carnitine CoA-transferase CaiB-like acyl-CoA transferase